MGKMCSTFITQTGWPCLWNKYVRSIFPSVRKALQCRQCRKALHIWNCLKPYGQMLPVIPIHEVILMRWQCETNMGNVCRTLSYSTVDRKIEQLSPFISTIPDLFPLVPISHCLGRLDESSLIVSHKSTKVTILTAQNYWIGYLLGRWL